MRTDGSIAGGRYHRPRADPRSSMRHRRAAAGRMPRSTKMPLVEVSESDEHCARDQGPSFLDQGTEAFRRRSAALARRGDGTRAGRRIADGPGEDVGDHRRGSCAHRPRYRRRFVDATTGTRRAHTRRRRGKPVHAIRQEVGAAPATRRACVSEEGARSAPVGDGRDHRRRGARDSARRDNRPRTTGAALAWALVHGANAPEAWSRVRTEPERYTLPFLTESLRLNPAVWGIPRTPNRSGVTVASAGITTRVRRGQLATVSRRNGRRELECHGGSGMEVLDQLRGDPIPSRAGCVVQLAIGSRDSIRDDVAQLARAPERDAVISTNWRRRVARETTT